MTHTSAVQKCMMQTIRTKVPTSTHVMIGWRRQSHTMIASGLDMALRTVAGFHYCRTTLKEHVGPKLGEGVGPTDGLGAGPADGLV